MSKVLETELWEFCMQRLNRDNVDAALDCTSKLDKQGLNDISKTLAQILSDDAMLSRVEKTEIATYVPLPEGFQSVLWKGSKDETTKKIVMFRFKDAAIESLLPLLGLALAVVTASPVTATMPLIGLAQNLWRSMEILRQPKDKDAIDLIETLLTHKATQISAEEPSLPVSKIEQKLDREILPAVHFLMDKKLIKVSQWAGQRGDLNNKSNHVRIVL